MHSFLSTSYLYDPIFICVNAFIHLQDLLYPGYRHGGSGAYHMMTGSEVGIHTGWDGSQLSVNHVYSHLGEFCSHKSTIWHAFRRWKMSKCADTILTLINWYINLCKGCYVFGAVCLSACLFVSTEFGGSMGQGRTQYISEQIWVMGWIEKSNLIFATVLCNTVFGLGGSLSSRMPCILKCSKWWYSSIVTKHNQCWNMRISLEIYPDI